MNECGTVADAQSAPKRREWDAHSYFIPTERFGVFQTHDRETYTRNAQGVIRRAEPKVRGKAARKAAKAQRRAK